MTTERNSLMSEIQQLQALIADLSKERAINLQGLKQRLWKLRAELTALDSPSLKPWYIASNERLLRDCEELMKRVSDIQEAHQTYILRIRDILGMKTPGDGFIEFLQNLKARAEKAEAELRECSRIGENRATDLAKQRDEAEARVTTLREALLDARFHVVGDIARFGHGLEALPKELRCAVEKIDKALAGTEER